MGVEQDLASKWNTIQEVSKTQQFETNLNIIEIDTEFGAYIKFLLNAFANASF